jgi:hypothetical protein
VRRLTAVDLDALDRQIRPYRSAVQIGQSVTDARPSSVMREHHALAHGLLDRQRRLPPVHTKAGGYQRTTTGLNATSA